MPDAIDADGQWLKGNLHTHSTNSDGELTPQQLVDLYAGDGYDFLAITDHNHLTPRDDLDDRGMVLLPGSELHGGKGELGQAHHLVAIGCEELIKGPETDDYREAVAYVAERCEFCFTAHPYWTSLTHLDIIGLQDVERHIAIEVYNFTCHRGIGRGESAVHWDQLLARGMRLWGLAVDDAHCHYEDALGGWIMLQAAERTPEAIHEAVRSGAFYASNGPQLKRLELCGDKLLVQCSPCREVSVIAPGAGCGTTTWRRDDTSQLVTDLAFDIPAAWPCIRVECIDAAGRKAWSNPVWRD